MPGLGGACLCGCVRVGVPSEFRTAASAAASSSSSPGPGAHA